MTLYLDTSLLVAGLTAELETERVRAWLQQQSSDELLVSDWVIIEFSAALSMKLRMQKIDATQRQTALMLFANFCSQTATVLPAERAQFQIGARFADQYARGLKAGDALHLAICREHGAILCTLDRRLSDTGPALGVPTLLV